MKVKANNNQGWVPQVRHSRPSLQCLHFDRLNIAFYGLIFVLSLYFQQIKNYSALKTGLAFLPITAIVLIANLYASRFSAWIESRLTC